MKTLDAVRDLLTDVKDEAEVNADGNTVGLCVRMLRDLETIPQDYNVEIENDDEVEETTSADVDSTSTIFDDTTGTVNVEAQNEAALSDAVGTEKAGLKGKAKPR